MRKLAATNKKQPKIGPTIGRSTYVNLAAMKRQPHQFEGLSIKVLYENKAAAEMACLLKWRPGASIQSPLELSLIHISEPTRPY